MHTNGSLLEKKTTSSYNLLWLFLNLKFPVQITHDAANKGQGVLVAQPTP